MADKKISELVELAAIPPGADVWIAAVVNGVTYRVRLSVLVP